MESVFSLFGFAYITFFLIWLTAPVVFLFLIWKELREIRRRMDT